MKKVSIINRTSGLMFAALFGGAILFSGCGGGGSIGKQMAKELCDCQNASATDRSGGFASLVCIGAWVEKYEEYFEENPLKTNEFNFKDKKIQKEFEKYVENCKKDYE